MVRPTRNEWVLMTAIVGLIVVGISSPFALAWAQHRNGLDRQAMATIDRALALGTRDAQIEFHASQIARSLSLDGKAGMLLARGHEDNSALLAFTPALAH